MEFALQYDAELLSKFPDYNGLVRLIVFAKFKTPTGWTTTREAIVDTGAHTCILPESAWRSAYTEIIGNHYVRGLIPLEECQIPVKVARVSATLFDRAGNSTGDIRFRAYLASTDDVPVIIGFKDLLDRGLMQFDSKKKTGYFEIP